MMHYSLRRVIFPEPSSEGTLSEHENKCRRAYPVRMYTAYIFMFAVLLCSAACHRGTVLPESSSKANGVYHTVQKGQTLWRICKTYQVSMQDVAELNNITDHSQIKVGDRLFIPGAVKQLPVESTVSTGAQPSSQPGGTPAPAAIPEPAAPVIEKNVGMFIWPIIGPISKRFGIQGGMKHDGIDIKGAPEANIMASRAGKVIFSNVLEGYGNTVIVQHDSNFVTVYANLGANMVARDQQVKQSQVLGRLLSSPAEKRYLHFQVRRDRQARNPLFYLPEAR
jgi:murein DD-endopeptidase MepM/ murein hydrolase activator NlpD